jgi:hypothetical protein
MKKKRKVCPECFCGFLDVEWIKVRVKGFCSDTCLRNNKKRKEKAKKRFDFWD